MKNIQVDSDGEMRCWSCGGKHFTEKRTFRAKAIGVTAGVATLGIAGALTPLLAGKKLKCQACGVYSNVGNAEPYSPCAQPEKKSPAATTTHPRKLPRGIDPNGYLTQDQLDRRRGLPSHHQRQTAPPAKTGQFLEVKKPRRPSE